jgi:L-serine dehydratase
METISVFDIFKIGVGPSSSHTMGPWHAALRFVQACRDTGWLDRIEQVSIDLFGSLAKTGRGHGTDLALLMGLTGLDPATCDPDRLIDLAGSIRRSHRLELGGQRSISFDPATQIIFHRDRCLPYHPNALRLTARSAGRAIAEETYYSVGGGFLLQDGDTRGPASPRPEARRNLPSPIDTAADVIVHCSQGNLSVAQLARQNESAWRSDKATSAGLLRIWQVMQRCVYQGCHTYGVLPGGLGVFRRAAEMQDGLLSSAGRAASLDLDAWRTAIRGSGKDFSHILRWISCFALAVNEENAAFGRVVTAPTNGAAGVIPAVLMYYVCFCDGNPWGIEEFLLTAGAIGMLFKKGATISAAMGGCQAEIGVSSAMAAAGLCQVLGGSVGQVLMAAEIAMEHHLGMTCDPVGGLVQVPCIERNAMGATKALTACYLALESDPTHARVPLDAVIRSMWATAQDMNSKYKETSEGGLAVLIPVSHPEC